MVGPGAAYHWHFIHTPARTPAFPGPTRRQRPQKPTRTLSALLTSTSPASPGSPAPTCSTSARSTGRRLKDRFDIAVEPQEWFLAPLPVIREVIERLMDGTIKNCRYDPESAKIVECEHE